MFIEQPPLIYRLLFPEAVWRLKKRRKRTVYLTFDDGPVPEVTPWVLDTLDRYGVRATFFMVGDNVRRGHSYGNHTMHHLQGMKVTARTYWRDICEADALLDSPLFRPPHGIMRWKQAAAIKHHYNIIMYDLVTRDYSRRLTPARVVDNVRRYARNGSIIVFHDSLKAERNLRDALPAEGYSFEVLPMQ